MNFWKILRRLQLPSVLRFQQSTAKASITSATLLARRYGNESMQENFHWFFNVATCSRKLSASGWINRHRSNYLVLERLTFKKKGLLSTQRQKLTPRQPQSQSVASRGYRSYRSLWKRAKNEARQEVSVSQRYVKSKTQADALYSFNAQNCSRVFRNSSFEGKVDHFKLTVGW